jgi:phosphate transport system substrate-binding protein
LKKGLVLSVSTAALALSLALTGCGSSAPKGSSGLSGTVTTAGSTALLPLVEYAAKEFMDKNPNVTVNPSGGGSMTGISQVESGNVNIGDSDVTAPATMTDLVDHQVAIVPFVMVTNPDVNVNGLTQQQAIGIFTGKITNWKELGGKDEKIVVINRPNSSGTRKTFQKIVLNGQDYTTGELVQDSNGTVHDTIASTPGAIGVIGAAYIDAKVHPLSYNGVPYTPENVKNNTYKIYAVEHMYTKGQPTGATKAFLDYILSDAFQKSLTENPDVAKMGFLPVK